MSIKEQSKYEMFDTKSQIKQRQQHIEQLTEWVEKHTPSHFEFENKWRELMSAKRKIQQLRQRHYRKYNKNSGLQEMYIPNIR